MTVTLKLSRAGFAMLIAVTSATTTYLAAVLPTVLPPNLVQATLPFVAAVGTAVIVYLSTEEQAVPP